MPFLADNPEIRQVIYGTNAIESLHARYRRSVRRAATSPPKQAAMPDLVTPFFRQTQPGVLRSLQKTQDASSLILAALYTSVLGIG